MSRSGGRELRRQVRYLVRSMGDTPDAVAGTLADAGARGSTMQPLDCVVSRYLKEMLADETLAEVDVRYYLVSARRAGSLLPTVVRLPEPVSSFIRAFDTRRYPDLIELPRDRALEPSSAVAGPGFEAAHGEKVGMGAEQMHGTEPAKELQQPVPCGL